MTTGRAVAVRHAALLHYLALAVVVVVAAMLRLTALGRQSLWFDEIDVVVRAQRPFREVLKTFTTAGENGPFYNLLLALWIRVAGISEVAVRFPSAVAGTLSVPLLYLLGRRMAGSSVALLAAGLLAISPYHVWYSQEAKMYALIVLLALLSSVTLVEALERNRAVWWVAWAVVTTLMFYTHVVSILVFAAQALYVVLARRSWPGRERGFLLAAAALTLPYIPVGLWAFDVVSGRARSWQPDVSLWDVLHVVIVKFAVFRADQAVERWAGLLYVVLAVCGAVVLARRGERGRWWLLAGSLALVPVVGLFVVSLRQSVFQDRYAIVALPALLLLVAAVVAWLLRDRRLWPLGVIAVTLLLVFSWGPLRDVVRSSQAEKEDWRSGYAEIARRVEPGDVYLIVPGYMTTTLQYYNQREPILRGHPVAVVTNVRDTGISSDDLVAELRPQIKGASRLWLIKSPDRADPEDPQHFLETWLAANGTVTYERVLNGVIIRLYELSPPT